jgi:uncharacterized protein
MQRKENFYSDGNKMAATLFLPDDIREGEKRPGIVLCHGFTCIKELILPDYASRFAEAGFVSLTFDYRGFGESGGERGKLIPHEQVADIRNAISFLQLQKEVDPQRTALWGTSFGAANAICTAGVDKRVKAIVSQVGFGDVERILKKRSLEELQVLSKLLEGDRKARILTGKSATISPLHILNDDESTGFFTEAIKQFPTLKCELPLEAVEAICEYKPESAVDKISPSALLLIAAEKDIVTPMEESDALFEKAKEPKKIITLPTGHYGIYAGEYFDKSVQSAIDWFKQYL